MSAREYFAAILPLIQRLDEAELPAIRRAGEAIADTIENGHRVWVPKTHHCLYGEATTRAGGFIPVHVLEDLVTIQPGDTVLAGTSVGTFTLAVDAGLAARERGATLIVLTTVAFENDPNTILEHPTQQRLHRLADVLIDLSGPVGDGVMEIPDTGVRIMPHSGATGVVAMWMIFSEAYSRLVERGKMPLLYQSVMVRGGRERNRALVDEYNRTGIGYQVS